MKILFIGGINLGSLPKGGEEYKNQLLFLKIHGCFEEEIIIDTYDWLRKPGTWLKLIKSLIIDNPDTVLISASSVSTYRLLKIIRFFRRSLIQKTTYMVIGGYFPQCIKEKYFNWRIYQDLKNIIVEGESLKQIIHEHSELTNISVISNFKNFPDLSFPIKESGRKMFHFVFVGRISSGKGVIEILEAAEILNGLNEDFSVDFYGPLEGEFDFDRDKVKYCGFLDFQKDADVAYRTLSEYDCMLFPTYWQGEGFPGVIIDAFIVGLPIIATDWNMNAEIIEEGINGYFVEPKNSRALADKMKFAIDNRDKLETIGKLNKKRSKYFHVDVIWPQIVALL